MTSSGRLLGAAALIGPLVSAVAAPRAHADEPPVAPSPPVAVAPPPTSASDAEALFRAGRAAMRAGDVRTACDRFAASHAREPAAGAILNLAVCEEQLARWARARRHYQQFLDAVPPDDDRRARATQALASIAEKMPRLHVALAPGWAADAEVRIDGEPVDVRSGGGWVSLDPGDHLVSVSSRSAAATREVHVVGEAGKVLASLVIDTPPAPPPPLEALVAPAAADVRPTEARSTPVLRTVGVATIASGVAAVGVGVVFTIRTVQRKEDSDFGCMGTICTPAAAPIRQQAQTAGNIATVAAIAGVSLAAAGVTMYFLGRPAAVGPVARVRFVPVADPRGVGGALAATF
jgi:hypothetical protein